MHMTTDVELGRRIHMVLWDRGLTQSGLALYLGIARPTMSQKLRGRRPFTISELLGVSEFLDVPAATFLDGLCAARDSNPEPADNGRATVTCLDAHRALRRPSQSARVA